MSSALRGGVGIGQKIGGKKEQTMSVVIKGFEKPSDCDYCNLQEDSYCNVLLSFINVEHGIDTRCPIAEISEYTLKNGHRVVVAEQTDCPWK